VNADLESLLNEAPELRAVVDALRPEEPSERPAADDAFVARVLAAVRRIAGSVREVRVRMPAWAPYATAAVLALAAGFAFRSAASAGRLGDRRVLSCRRADGSFSATSAAPWVQAYAIGALAADAVDVTALTVAVDALVRDQRADGGWCNDALSVRNTAALLAASRAGVPGTRKAYRRAVRYLHARGIPEISTEELACEGRALGDRLAGVMM